MRKAGVEEMFQMHSLYTTRSLAMLTICASVLLAAVGVSALSAQVVRDPENPAFVGNAIGSSTTTTNGQTVRDPENPYWTGAMATGNASAGSGGRSIETGYRGATQGLR